MTATQTKPKKVPRKSIDYVHLSIELIDPHPKNPGRGRITKANTTALAADIKAHGLQQPIKVRTKGERYEIIFGERRYRAVKQLNHKSIVAEIHDVDDLECLMLMAIENGQREDLDPIAVARHLVELTTADNGHAGLTQTEAGKCYGLSQGEVANRIRVLKLPACWQGAIISGEITAKKARLLVPFADAPQLLEKLYQDFKKEDWIREEWAMSTESEIEDQICRDLESLTRPIDKRVKHYYGWPMGQHPRYFELTDEVRKNLGCVELPLGNRPKKGAARAMVEVAINTKLWEKLNKPLVEAANKKKQGGNGKASNGKAKPAPKLSKAEQEKRDRERREKRRIELTGQLTEWRLRMLRLGISEEIQAGDWRTNIAAAYCFAAWGRAGDRGDIETLLNIAAHELAGKKSAMVREPFYCRGCTSTAPLFKKLVAACVEDGDEQTAADRIHATVARITLWPVSSMVGARGKPIGWIGNDQPKWSDTLPPLSSGAVEQMADLWGVTVLDGWLEGATLRRPQRELVRQVLELHRKAELRQLFSSIGTDKDKHGDLVKLILEAHRKPPLRLPGALAGRKRKAKK